MFGRKFLQLTKKFLFHKFQRLSIDFASQVFYDACMLKKHSKGSVTKPTQNNATEFFHLDEMLSIFFYLS